MSLLESVAARLAAEAVPRALIGAAALAAAGVSRSTHDLDLLVTDLRVLDEAFWAPLRGAGIVIDVRRGDSDDPLAGVVRIESAGERPVDVIVGRHAWQARAVERARSALGPTPIVLPRDLVLLKLYAGGRQDLWDVRELLALPGSERLIAEVDADLERLPPAMRQFWLEARE